jgi:transposase
MNQEMHTHLRWIKHYQASGNLGVTCQRCGISRPTLRKWLQRYEESGLAGLVGNGRRPNNSPNKKIFVEEEQLVLLLRFENNLGARRIQNELKRQHQLSLSLATIYKILTKNKVKPLRRPKREKRILRYSRPIPGERVQVDTCKIVPDIYINTPL